MCNALPYPRCSHHARERLQAALASGDRARIGKAYQTYYTSPAGIAELREAGREVEAARYERRRRRLIAAAKRIEAAERAHPIRLGLDLDNTTGSFTAGMRRHAARELGITDEEALRMFPDPSNYSFVKSGWFKDTAEFLRMKDAAEAAGVYREMEAYPEAIETLKRLAKDGRVEIHVITARDARWADGTRLWLETHGIPYKSITHTDAKEETDMDVYLDDASYQVQKLREHGKKVIVFDQIYNTDTETKDLPRVHGWRELPALLRTVARDRGTALPTATVVAGHA